MPSWLCYRDEELLGRGLEINDSIQSLLARHDAIASGSPLPIQGTSSSTLSTEVHSSVNQTEVKGSSPGESFSAPKASPSALVLSETRGQSDEEEEDEFAQLARRLIRTNKLIFQCLWKHNFISHCTCEMKLGSISNPEYDLFRISSAVFRDTP